MYHDSPAPFLFVTIVLSDCVFGEGIFQIITSLGIMWWLYSVYLLSRYEISSIWISASLLHLLQSNNGTWGRRVNNDDDNNTNSY